MRAYGTPALLRDEAALLRRMAALAEAEGQPVPRWFTPTTRLPGLVQLGPSFQEYEYLS